MTLPFKFARIERMTTEPELIASAQADHDCAVIVMTSDGYDDAWIPFLTLFFKYWPDCPFPVYFVSNTKICTDPRVQTLLGGDYGRDWGTPRKKAFEKISQKYIIYLQEDFLLNAPVNTAYILELLSAIKKYNAACLRLCPSPLPDKDFPGTPYGETTKGLPYSVSLQAVIWNKQIFDDLLLAGESPWDAEMKGSLRTVNVAEPFLSLKKGEMGIPYFSTGIKRGIWLYDANQLLKREGIIIDPKRRPIESYSAYLVRRLCHLPFLGRYISYFDRIIRQNYRALIK